MSEPIDPTRDDCVKAARKLMVSLEEVEQALRRGLTVNPKAVFEHAATAFEDTDRQVELIIARLAGTPPTFDDEDVIDEAVLVAEMAATEVAARRRVIAACEGQGRSHADAVEYARATLRHAKELIVTRAWSFADVITLIDRVVAEMDGSSPLDLTGQVKH